MTIALIIALVLDAAMGEPRWLWDRFPHPAVLMGRPIAHADRHFNTAPNQRAKGVMLVILLVIGAGAIGAAIAALPGQVLDVIIAAMLLAHRSLIDHVRAVADGLRMSLGDGRMAVSNIVGRDTGQMDQSAVVRSGIESAAENMSDGVIAPAFWFLIVGLPGLLIYKAINTADSMIGYRTPRYEAFGWAAARLDDLLNLIPARLTAAMIWLVSGRPGSWSEIQADARLHRSPNAGWPEAAMARAVDAALSGPRSYDGALQPFPFVNEAGRKTLAPTDLEAATAVLWRVWTLGGAICVTLILLW